MLRLLAFMVVLYPGLGWLAERYVTKPNSKVKGFFRLLCGPVTRPWRGLCSPRRPSAGSSLSPWEPSRASGSCSSS